MSIIVFKAEQRIKYMKDLNVKYSIALLRLEMIRLLGGSSGGEGSFLESLRHTLLGGASKSEDVSVDVEELAHYSEVLNLLLYMFLLLYHLL